GPSRVLHSFPTRRSSDLDVGVDDAPAVHRAHDAMHSYVARGVHFHFGHLRQVGAPVAVEKGNAAPAATGQWLAPSGFSRREVQRSEEHTSELQSPCKLVC